MNRHLTEDEICRAIAGQSTLDEQRHATACGECRAEIARTQNLFTLLRHDICRRTEQEALRTMPVLRHSPVRTARRTWALAAASIGLVAAALAWQFASQRAGRSIPAHQAERASGLQYVGVAGTADVMNAFYPLQYSTVPVTNGQIVRIEVPRSAPAAFGLDPVNFVRAKRGGVLADVVVGEDGLARAVRFVRPATDVNREEK
jgi:hypothetical protein